MLQFNTQNLKKDTVKITSTDSVFIGTALESKGFTITVSDLKHKDQTNILYGNVNDDGSINQGSYQEALFVASIVAVDGIVDEHQKPITLENGVREILFEYADDLLRDEIVKAIQSFKKKAEKKSTTPTLD